MKKFLIVAGQFNELVTRSLVESSLCELKSSGIADDQIETVWVPGCFEMPLTAKKAAQTGKYAAVICLGAVIKGETPHFDYVSAQAASGIMNAGLDTGIPVIFGVLTTNTVEQAMNRAGLKYGNKGADAANTAIKMTKILETYQ